MIHLDTKYDYLANLEKSMQLYEIRTDAQGQELTVHGEIPFPLSKYENTMWAFPTRQVPWHWHTSCEIVRVAEGALAVQGAGQSLTLLTGQSAFINANVVHSMQALNERDCRLINILFDPSILGGAAFSVFHSKYVLALTECASLPLCPLTGGADWQKDTERSVGQLEEELDTRGFGFELRVRSILGDIWLHLLKQADLASSSGPSASDPYIHDLLSFVHAHFNEPLTLEKIAAGAGISTRTCNRSFRTQLGMSVFDYLLSYRVRRSCELLVSSSDSITSISMAVGFNDSSYFSKVFRKATGKTPREYRAAYAT